MSINTKKYIEEYIKIRDKNSNIIPLKLNEPQLKLYNVIKEQKVKKKPIRILVLKSRQMGFSTETEAIIFKNTVTKTNNSVTSDTVINYGKIDTDKLLAIEGEEDNVIKDGKVKLDDWLDFAEQFGTKCE